MLTQKCKQNEIDKGLVPRGFVIWFSVEAIVAL